MGRYQLFQMSRKDFLYLLHSLLLTQKKENVHFIQWHGFYRPQTKFAKVMFSQTFVWPQGGSRSLSKEGVSVQGRGVSVQGRGVSVQGRGSLSKGGGLCPGEGVSVQGRGSLSIQGRGLCPGEWGLCLGDLCPGGLCPGVFVQGSLFRGSLSREFSVQVGSLSGKPPQTETPYGNERVVRILLECIFVVFDFKTRLFT